MLSEDAALLFLRRLSVHGKNFHLIARDMGMSTTACVAAYYDDIKVRCPFYKEAVPKLVDCDDSDSDSPRQRRRKRRDHVG